MNESLSANLQLLYVSDIAKSTQFYKTLFNAEPVYAGERYVAFPAGDKGVFALWSGGAMPDVAAQRYSEVGIMLPSNEAVDKLYEQWRDQTHINIAEKPTTEVYGRTFLVKDPDGHMIRICPFN